MSQNSTLRKFFIFLRWAWFVSGLALILVSLVFTAHTAMFLHRSLSTSGTVVGLTQQRDSDDAVGYAPIFRFKAQSGLAYSISSKVATNPPSFDVGETVPVLYDEIKPEEAKIGNFGQLWLIQLVFGGLGIFFTLGSYIISRLLYRRDGITKSANQPSSGFAA